MPSAAFARWSWVLPLLSGVAGVNSAVLALIAKQSTPAGDADGILLAVVASLGIVLSWTLLQVGAAQIYQAVEGSSAEPGIEFPGGRPRSMLDYLYFSFTVATAFAVSDARVLSTAIRRVVLVHSAISFFYNALVVAIAFQVLQQLV